MKKYNLILTAMLVIALCFAACSSDDEPIVVEIANGTAGSLTWTLTEDGTLTISGNGEMANYTYNSETVLSTAPWYSHRNTITKVVIADSVTSIGDYAFCHCAGLTSITLPSSLTSIGNDVFLHCTRLTSITLPNSLTSIGRFAFYYCV